MRSVIGDYVHFGLENYLIYGTAFRGERKQPLTESYKAQKRKNLERINNIKEPPKAILEELEKRISNEKTQQQAKEIAQNLVEFNTSLNNITAKLEEKLLTEVPAKFSSSDSGVRIIKSKIQTDNSMVNIEEARKARRRFYDNIATINNNAKRGKPIRNSTIETLLKNASDFFNHLGIVNNKLDFIKYRDLQNSNTLAALSNMIRLVSLSEINKATLHGVYGEVLGNMVSDQIKGLTGKELEQTLKEILKNSGGHVTSYQIDESMIAPSVQQTFLQETDINLYQIHASQDKVDGTIIIKDKEINESIKAYTPSGNIIVPHLQDVGLITSLIATEEQFGNHWLNIHALQLSRPLVDEELVKHIQYEALASGNLLKKGNAIADTFVAIDTIKGRTYIKTTKDILRNESKFFILKPRPEAININDKWEATWEKRISNILLSLHQQKISVSYKVSFK